MLHSSLVQRAVAVTKVLGDSKNKEKRKLQPSFSLPAKGNEAKERPLATLVPASRDCFRLCICLRRAQKLALLRQFGPFFHSQTHRSAAWSILFLRSPMGPAEGYVFQPWRITLERSATRWLTVLSVLLCGIAFSRHPEGLSRGVPG